MRVPSWLSATLIGMCLLMGEHPAAAQDMSRAETLPHCPMPPFSWSSRYFISPDSDHDLTIFARAGDQAWSLYRSTDYGQTWEISIDTTDIWSLAFSPSYADDQTLYAAPRNVPQGQGFLARSTDGGMTWDNVPLVGPDLGGAFPALAMVNANTLYLALSGGPGGSASQKGLYYSNDSGATWEQRAWGDVNDLALSPRYAEDHTLFIAARSYKSNHGLFKSTDAGRTWVARNEGLYLDGGATTTSIVFSPGYPEDPVMFCQSTSIFFLSTDAGDSWAKVYPLEWPLHPPISSDARWELSPYFVRDRTAWIEFGSQMTTDAGNSWEGHEFGSSMFEGLAARRSCTAAGRCGVLLVGGRGGAGIYKSYDLGRTWHCPQEDVTPPWAAIPAEVPEPDTWLLLGTGLAGLAAWQRLHDQRR